MEREPVEYEIRAVERVAIDTALRWFERNSGWAPPDDDTLAEWVADGVCRCPDECLVTPDGICPHGLASWALILQAQLADDLERTTRGRPARRRGAPFESPAGSRPPTTT